jgi:hypothetical protein
MRRARKGDGGGGFMESETTDEKIERIFYEQFSGVATMDDVAKELEGELDEQTLRGFTRDGTRRRCRRVIGRAGPGGEPRAAAIESGNDPRWVQIKLWSFDNFEFVIQEREKQHSGGGLINFRLRARCLKFFGREPAISDRALRAYYDVLREEGDGGGNPEGFVQEPDDDD